MQPKRMYEYNIYSLSSCYLRIVNAVANMILSPSRRYRSHTLMDILKGRRSRKHWKNHLRV